MQRGKRESILCIFLFLISFFSSGLNINIVSAQSGYETFERNPVDFWTLNNMNGLYHPNNTVSLTSDIETFSRRKYINITGSSGSGTNYQIRIEVNYDSDMQEDFGDIIFVDNDEETFLDYWMETKIDSVSAVFWVEIKDDLEDNLQIYMYYGNENVDTLSNGIDTFIVYEDWETQSIQTSVWDITNVDGSVSYSAVDAQHGYVIRVDADASATYGIKTDYDTASPFSTVFRCNLESPTTGNSLAIGSGSPAAFGFSMVDSYYSANPIYRFRVFDDDGNQDTQTMTSTYFDTWTRFEITRDGTYAKLYADSSLIETASFSPDAVATNPAFSFRILDSEDDIYLDWIFVRKFISTEPILDSFGNEEEVDFGVGETFVLIPLIENEDISVKTMIEIPIFYDDEIVTFSLNTSLGIDSDLVFSFNNTYDSKLRIEIVAKNRINVYRINIYTEFQTFVERIETSHLISKEITHLVINCSNFSTSSRLILYFLSGTLDYSLSRVWEHTEENVAGTRFIPDVITPFSISIRENADFSKRSNDSFSTEFRNFQYIRCYNDIQYDYTHPISNDQYVFSTMKLKIAEYTILFRTMQLHGGEAPETQGTVQVLKDSVEVYFMNEGSSEYTTEHDVLINNFKVWRTFEDKLGIAFASDNDMFRWNDDERRTIEEFTYFYTDVLSNFSGTATSYFESEITLVSAEYIFLQTDFREMEYSFNADFGIAEPHFSSTYYSFIPLYGVINQLWTWGTTIVSDFADNLGIPETVDNLFDYARAIGDAVGLTLEPIFSTLSDAFGLIIQDLFSALEPILDSIFDVLDTVVSSVGDSIVAWAGDVLDFLIASLMGILVNVADFLFGFVNVIGALFGITGLAGILTDIIVHFTTSITAFLLGVGLVITVFYSGFTLMITIVNTYLPMLMSLAGLFVMLHVVGAIVSMDDTKIRNMVGVYANIFDRFLSIMFKVANMVIQFIGGILP